MAISLYVLKFGDACAIRARSRARFLRLYQSVLRGLQLSLRRPDMDHIVGGEPVTPLLLPAARRQAPAEAAAQARPPSPVIGGRRGASSPPPAPPPPLHHPPPPPP